MTVEIIRQSVNETISFKMYISAAVHEVIMQEELIVALVVLP